MSLDVAAMHYAAWALLDACTNLDVMDGSVDDAGQPGPTMDADGRAHMYAVLYFGAGRLTSDRASGIPSTITGTFQVTCAGGDSHRARVAAAKVRAALTGARLTASSGLVEEYMDPGPPREDTTAVPSRWFVPVLFSAFHV